MGGCERGHGRVLRAALPQRLQPRPQHRATLSFCQRRVHALRGALVGGRCVGMQCWFLTSQTDVPIQFLLPISPTHFQVQDFHGQVEAKPAHDHLVLFANVFHLKVPTTLNSRMRIAAAPAATSTSATGTAAASASGSAAAAAQAPEESLPNVFNLRIIDNDTETEVRTVSVTL